MDTLESYARFFGLRIEIEEWKTGLLCATSPDLSGLLVVARTMDALEEAIPRAIGEMYTAIRNLGPVAIGRLGPAAADSYAAWSRA
jgi:hypothetical protein